MKARLLNFTACLATTVVLCIQSSSAEAIYADIKAIGMGGTCISYPLDTLSGAYNPAGLSEVGDRLDVEAGWIHNTGSLTVKNNLAPVGINGHFNGMQDKNMPAANFGINKTFCTCAGEFTAGLIVYNRAYQKTSYGKPLLLFGTSKPGLEYLNETISPIFTFRINEMHSFGISVNYQIERLKVNGIENFKALSVHPENLTNRGYDYATGWGVTIGYLGHITDCLSVGLTYQPRTPMSKLNKYKGFLASGRLNVPAKISGGISYRIMPCVVAAFDVEYIQWSGVKSLHNPLLHDGLLFPLGTDNGPGFGFRDQTFYRAGIEWQICEAWTARIGYRYANSPIRRSQTAVNALTLDAVESFITTGATYCLNPCNEFSFSFAWGFEHEIKGKSDSIPLFVATPTGHIVPFGGGQANLKEQKFALGAAWGYKF